MITRETTINPLMQIFICSIFLEAPNRIVTLPFLVSPHHSVSSYRGSGSPDRPATSPLFPNTGLESSRSTMQAMPFLMQETSRWRQEEPSAQRRHHLCMLHHSHYIGNVSTAVSRCKPTHLLDFPQRQLIFHAK